MKRWNLADKKIDRVRAGVATVEGRIQIVGDILALRRDNKISVRLSRDRESDRFTELGGDASTGSIVVAPRDSELRLKPARSAASLSAVIWETPLRSCEASVFLMRVESA
jgi:hypothetical protein